MLHKKQRLAVLVAGALAAGSAQAVDNATRIFFDNSVYTSPASGDDASPTTTTLATFRTDLLAFEWQGTVYSTGVDDTLLTDVTEPRRPASFVETKFRMLPLTDVPLGPANFYMGALPRDEPAPPGQFNSATAADITELVKDGTRGLDFTTGIFNLGGNLSPGVTTGEFPFGGTIKMDAVGDGEPDLLFAKLGGEINATDMRLVDDAGNQLGDAVNVNPGTAAGEFLGDLQVDLYDFNDTGALIDQTRAFTLFVVELSEFNLTSTELADAEGLEVDFPGGLDFTFLAANEGSIPTASGIDTIDSPTGCTNLGGGQFLLTPSPKVQVVNADGDKVEQAGIVVKAVDLDDSDSVDFLDPPGDTEETTDANGIATFDNLIVDNCDNPGDLNTTFVITSPGFDPSELEANDDDESVLEDSGINSLAVVDNDDFGPNGPAATAIVIPSGSGPSNGSATVINGGTPNDPTDDTVDYEPADADFFGTDSFDYEIKDSTGTTSTATVTVTVEPVNDAPSFTKGADQTVNEDAGGQTINGWASDISVGPANESGQSITGFNVSNNNNGLFASQPSISTAGALSYTPADDAAGIATVTVSLSDDGGTTNGGADTSPDQTFTITVNAVNDAPSFTKGADQTVNEDAGGQTINGWASGISVGPANESGQGITGFNVTNNNNGLFASQPAIDSSGNLSYMPAADANGSAMVTVSVTDDGGISNGGSDTSGNQTFTITVNAVNDASSFTKGADQTVDEDAVAQTVAGWATNISVGPSNESSQSISDFNVGNDNNGLFATQPDVDNSGNLSYAPATDANGSATVTVSVTDDGGTANGGSDTSGDQTFTITVDAVNDAPSFTKGADQTVDEDAVAQTVSDWATSISPGPTNESSQTVSFNVSNDNNALFSVQPAISPSGELSYTPDDDENGSASVTVSLSDDGGTANGGEDTSGEQIFAITINAFNDAPSFTAGSDQTVDEDAGAQTVSGWATSISPGPTNESSQTVSFNVSNDNNALFSVQPAISPSGELSYTPDDDENGSASITVSLSDDGGTANGGEDTSGEQIFTITINAVNDAPEVNDDTATTDEDMPVTIDVLANDSDIDGNLDLATVQVVSGPNNGATTVNATSGEITYTPNADFNGSDNFDYEVCDDGTPTPPKCGQAPVSISVGSVNDLPTASDDAAEVDEDDSVTIAVLANDNFGGDGPGTGPIEIVANPADGTVTVDDGGTPNDPTDDTVVYEPADEFFGTDAFDYRITDADGDTARATVQVSVKPVNDSPAITLSGDQASDSGSGEQVVSNFATNFEPGPNELGQSIAEFIVSNDDNALFAVQPTIGTDGTLSYTPNDANLEGIAEVTVRVRDDGGTANGGQDLSQPQTFNISIGVSADVEISVTGPANAAAGSEVAYTVNVTNNGPSQAEGVVVSVDVPDSVTFVSAEPPCSSGFPCSIGGLTASSPAAAGGSLKQPGLQTIDVGEVVEFDATFRLGSNLGGNEQLSWNITSNGGDPNPGNNDDQSTLGVAALPVPVLGRTGLLLLCLMLALAAIVATRRCSTQAG